MARQYRTLGDLRSELRACLGFASSGAAAGPNQTLIDSHLRTAQNMIYNAHDWAHLRKYETLSLGSAQYLLDYPATANQDRVKALSVYRGGVWSKPLDKGISPQLYTYQDNPSWPQRWEPYEQIQIWPLSDQAYSIRCFFIRALSAFTSDSDRATVDDEDILLIAKWTTKAHYRQPDMPIYKEMGEALLNRLKARSWGQSTFHPNDYTNDTPMVRPVVV
jgi:hypothetical protein